MALPKSIHSTSIAPFILYVLAETVVRDIGYFKRPFQAVPLSSRGVQVEIYKPWQSVIDVIASCVRKIFNVNFEADSDSIAFILTTLSKKNESWI